MCTDSINQLMKHMPSQPCLQRLKGSHQQRLPTDSRRHTIHDLAEELGLLHVSEGRGRKRTLTLRKNPPRKESGKFNPHTNAWEPGNLDNFTTLTHQFVGKRKMQQQTFLNSIF